MSTGKKVSELRVCDLKTELEKRGLETGGIKIALVDRLKLALTQDGKNPDEYVFENSPKKRENPTAPGNGVAEEDENSTNDTSTVVEAEVNATEVPPAKIAKIEAAVESTEPEPERKPEVKEEQKEEKKKENEEKKEEKKEEKEEPEQENEQDEDQLTVVDSDKIDSNTLDNDDSLNLTIGEDEAKIFQDEELDEKVKVDNNKNEKKPNDSTKNSTPIDASNDGENKSSVSSASASKKGTTDDADDDEGDDDDDAENAGKNGANESAEPESKCDDTSDSNAANKKTDDSETKTSSSKSSKDDKESSLSSSKTGTNSSSGGKASTAKTGSSSTSSASRNLWVSGLSSLTRATDLKIVFSKYGKVIGAKVVTNTRTPGTRCYGYVTMNSSSDAAKCISQLNRTELHGRIISVERAKSDMGGITNKAKPSATTTTNTSGSTPGDAKKADETKSAERKKVVKDEKADGSGAATKSSGTSGGAATADAGSVGKGSTKESSSAKKGDAANESGDGAAKTRKHDSKSRSDGERPARRASGGPAALKRSTSSTKRAGGRPAVEARRERDVLSFQKIREERDRQRLRERERKVREEERHRLEARRRQREEEDRLHRERERLKKERLRLEREKADLLRLERERQKLEREKIELERLELKRQQLKIEEAKRAIKRSAPTSSTDNDRYSGDIDRKRSASDRRFEPPPPPRFDTAIRSSTYDRPPEKKRIDDYPSTSSKRNDDYKSSTRGNGTSGMGSSGEVSSSFKRPLNDYPKRGNELDMPSRSTNSNNAYDNRGAPPLSSAKDHRFNEPIDSRSSGANFGRSRADERDMRGSMSSGKSRYMDGGNSNDRYSDSSAWGNPNNGAPSSVKPFIGMPSQANNDPWGQMNKQPPADNGNWNRSIEHQHQDRYDRTYNERKSSQYMDGPGVGNGGGGGSGGGRPASFIANSRPQDRYNSNSMSSRFDSSRF